MVVVEGVARSLDPKLDMWSTAEPVVREWMTRYLGPAGRLEGAVEGARELGRFAGGLPGLLTRGARVLDQLDAITRDGLVLSPRDDRGIDRPRRAGAAAAPSRYGRSRPCCSGW